ncbi:MAG TPA: metallophosphoesterase [Chloroflexota bacterium]|nr:metallophosphoesterase [Chloroflexota bacterium]
MTIPTPAEAVTYAVGDLHGEVTLLKQLLDALPLRDQDTIVFLGDYLDRGESSAATVDTLRDLSHRHDGCVFLRGNHEDAWLSHWNGLRFMRAPDIDGAQHVWDEFGGAVPYDFGRWLEKTLIEYEDDHAYYVHAGLLPGRPAWRTPPVLKLWGPSGFLESDYDWGKPVVFGHYPRPAPILQPNKIGVDTGAHRTGVLTAVRLPDRALFQARREGR